MPYSTAPAPFSSVSVPRWNAYGHVQRARRVWQALTVNPHLSIRELTSAAELSSTSVAAYCLNTLARNGIIRRTPGTARGIVVLRRFDGEWWGD